MSFFITNPKYKEGFVVKEYNGQVQLIAAKQGTDKIYETWGEIEIAKDKKKRLPVAVNLGSDPIAVLTLLMEHISSKGEAPPF